MMMWSLLLGIKNFAWAHNLLCPILLCLWILVSGTTGSPHHTHDHHCGNQRPQLKLESRTKQPDNVKVMVVTCKFPCDPKFVPEITIIPCTTAQQCDRIRPCLDKGYKEQNKDICWTEDYRNSTELEYRKYGMNGLIRCTDQNNASLETTDFILKPEAIPGRRAERESLLQGKRRDLIAINHLDGGGSTPNVIYAKDGVQAFYRHGTEKIWASPSRFFFSRKCDWILRHHDGSAIELYKDNGMDQPFARETLQFEVPHDGGAFVCSVQWYNSTTRLEKMFPFTVIDPLHPTTIPKIDKSRKSQGFVGFGQINKIYCPFSGGDGVITWFSRNETFANESRESYRYLMDGGKLVSVKEVKYSDKDYEDGKFLDDVLTCVVKNEFGMDTHAITLTSSPSTGSSSVWGQRTPLLNVVSGWLIINILMRKRKIIEACNGISRSIPCEASKREKLRRKDSTTDVFPLQASIRKIIFAIFLLHL